MRALIIGAGLAGATSARILADKGYEVMVYESQKFVGGMCNDELTNEYYKQNYGPHIWHTSIESVQEFISRFTTILPVRHKVRAITSKRSDTHFPITSQTLEDIGQDQIDNTNLRTDNFEIYLKDKIGSKTYEELIKHYTERQWGMSPTELDYSLASRITVNLENPMTEFFDHEKYVGFPNKGFTAMIQEMLDHPKIKVHTDLEMDLASVKTNSALYTKVVITSRLDKFVTHIETLPFRKVSFEFRNCTDHAMYDDILVHNNCNPIGEFSRVSHYHKFFKAITNREGTIIEGYEYPNDTYGVACYPITVVPTIYRDSEKLNTDLKNIISRSLASNSVHFLGRLASYKYLDMDKVILQVMEELA